MKRHIIACGLMFFSITSLSARRITLTVGGTRYLGVGTTSAVKGEKDVIEILRESGKHIRIKGLKKGSASLRFEPTLKTSEFINIYVE